MTDSSLCSLCPRRKSLSGHSFVPPDGPLTARILFIGEGPGKVENRTLIPFSGPTGLETNERYLPMAGLRRDSGEVRFSNVIKCYLDKPPQELADCCAARHISLEIDEMPNLELIVPMGALAVRALFPEIDLRMQHGIPVTGEWERIGWSGTVFPVYHPAAGLYSDPDDYVNYATYLRDDFETLRRLIRGDNAAAVIDPFTCPEDDLEYREIRNLDDWNYFLWVEDHLPVSIYDSDPACDTEIDEALSRPWKKIPYCLSLSTLAGTGFVVRADNTEILSLVREWIPGKRVTFHNYPFDSEVLGEMGIVCPRYDDTMVRAYHLQNLPQSLKVLAYRLLGMRMEEYEDLVNPYHRTAAVEYLRTVAEGRWPQDRKPRQSPIWKRAGRILTEMTTKGADPVARWWMIPDSERRWAEEWVGPMPGRSLTMVPWERVIPYSGRDADATKRLKPVLVERARELRREV